MASRNDVAEAAAELRRRVAWRNEAVGPADHGTVELCYWSVRCMAALMRLEPETLMACVCSIESGPCERVDVFHVSGRFWSTSACGEKRTPARPAWTSFPS
ncbi:Transposase [Bifidobacterium longum subsp. longum]|nr:Transposase [Bifidobacterium longum subsp. longum]